MGFNMNTPVITTTNLASCEEVIRSGRETFIKVGSALCIIRDHRLYTEKGYGSFQEYCEDVWDWGKSYVSRVISAAEIAKKLPIGNSVETESQARALSNVRPEHRAEVLEMAAKSGKVTAKTIEDAAEEFESPKPAAVKASESKEETGGHSIQEATITPSKDADFREALGVGVSGARNWFASQVEDIAGAIIDDASDEQLAAAISQWEVELRKLRAAQKQRKAV